MKGFFKRRQEVKNGLRICSLSQFSGCMRCHVPDSSMRRILCKAPFCMTNLVCSHPCLHNPFISLLLNKNYNYFHRHQLIYSEWNKDFTFIFIQLYIRLPQTTVFSASHCTQVFKNCSYKRNYRAGGVQREDDSNNVGSTKLFLEKQL